VMGTVTLGTLLYSQLKMENGMSMFCGAHKGASMGAVDVVIGDWEEAEHTLLMMN